MTMLCHSYPRKKTTEQLAKSNEDDEMRSIISKDVQSAVDEQLVLEGEPSFIKQLKMNSIHFRSFTFRSAFFTRCLDTGCIGSLLREGMSAPTCARRHFSGVACRGRSRPPQFLIQDLPGLECEAIAAAHECRTPGLIFELHAMEDLDGFVPPEEGELLERTNYGLAYIKPMLRHTMAKMLIGKQTQVASVSDVSEKTPADSYPRAGDEDGLMLQNLWVLRSHLHRPEAAAWLLPLAYGIVPARISSSNTAPLRDSGAQNLRLKYKRQVAAAVRAAAMCNCDALLVGSAAGLPGTCSGEMLSPEEAASVWAEVLLGTDPWNGEGGDGTSLDRYFKLIVFCLGGGLDGHRIGRSRIALRAAFGLS